MRYFLLIFTLAVLTVLVLAGRRGSLSSNRPIEVFPDMRRQPKLRPQNANAFFANGLSSQLPVAGAIARDEPYEDSPMNTGKVAGTTNWVSAIPIPVTAELMARGQERFNIYCAACHGATGEGNGTPTKFGMAVIASLHDIAGRKVPQQPDGQVFNTITHGLNLMGAYGGLISVQDRWAIVAYLRALELSRLAALDDVPAERRAELTKPLPPAAAAPATPAPAAPAAPTK